MLFWEDVNEVPDTPGTQSGIGRVLTVTGTNDKDYAWRSGSGGGSETGTSEDLFVFEADESQPISAMTNSDKILVRRHRGDFRLFRAVRRDVIAPEVSTIEWRDFTQTDLTINVGIQLSSQTAWLGTINRLGQQVPPTTSPLRRGEYNTEAGIGYVIAEQGFYSRGLANDYTPVIQEDFRGCYPTFQEANANVTKEGESFAVGRDHNLHVVHHIPADYTLSLIHI